jgi:hypothetical protein
MLAYQFIKWVDEQLKAEGVQVVYAHVKSAFNFGSMLRRLGYQDHDVTYARRL